MSGSFLILTNRTFLHYQFQPIEEKSKGCLRTAPLSQEKKKHPTTNTELMGLLVKATERKLLFTSFSLYFELLII